MNEKIDRNKFRAESEDFAKANLKECAIELLEWSETAILRDGKVRELAVLCKKWVDARDALNIAENVVKRAALEKVAKG